MTTATVIHLEDVRQAVETAMRNSMKSGRGWHYVRVWPEGTIACGVEASKCVPADEYYRRGRPHPVTVWAEQASWLAGPGDGVFQWEECDPAEAEFWADEAFSSHSEERDGAHPVPCRLSDEWCEPPAEMGRVMDGVREALEEAGYTVEE